MPRRKSTVLTVIVISQFLCTTTWFGGNAVLADLSKELEIPVTALGEVTSAVQLGFIIGTLIYALLTIADRFRPSTVFLCSAAAAAFVNGIIAIIHDFNTLLILRFCTGFFLAGIYPVGMKIASDHYDKGLGKALGFLVGALVLGTSFPHLLKSFSIALSWRSVITITSLLSLTGGVMMWFFVPEGPYRKKTDRPQMGLAFKVFRPKAFRPAAFGYFGHMWELYTFWAFVPVIARTFIEKNHIAINVSLLSFFVIAVGAVACIASGYISGKIGSKRTAFIALMCSCFCCILSPFSFSFPLIGFIAYLLFWGWMVIADSPMFSTLVAQNAPAGLKGTALTIVTCIGFFITIVSIQILDYLSGNIKGEWLYLFLAPGPLLGLLAMMRKQKGEDL
jgi:predicted MFS family arabinose efflux permease